MTSMEADTGGGAANGTPAPYGRACTNCARAKCRCIYRPGGSDCERYDITPEKKSSLIYRAATAMVWLHGAYPVQDWRLCVPSLRCRAYGYRVRRGLELRDTPHPAMHALVLPRLYSQGRD
jgi:hypothetical protein